jgi:hypothetical protein
MATILSKELSVETGKHNLVVSSGEDSDQLSNYQRLKKVSAPWSYHKFVLSQSTVQLFNANSGTITR